MSELNKHILLAMKWLDDEDSVSRSDLKSIQSSTYGSKFASYAHQSAYTGNRASAEISIDNYFTHSGENRQHYINAIEEEKVSSKKESATEGCFKERKSSASKQMNKISDFHLLFLVALSMAIGCVMTSMIVYSKLEDNTIGGYHCQPVTTHSTLEEAKAKVIEYQERVK